MVDGVAGVTQKVRAHTLNPPSDTPVITKHSCCACVWVLMGGVAGVTQKVGAHT